MQGLWVKIQIIIRVFLQNDRRRGIFLSGPLIWIWMVGNEPERERERTARLAAISMMAPWPEMGSAHGIRYTNHGFTSQRHQEREEMTESSAR